MPQKALNGVLVWAIFPSGGTSIVMKWTGHNDYKSMKPYIDIVDSIKASEMSKMNFMD